MDILITKNSKTDQGHCIEMICGKKEAHFYQSSGLDYVNVICRNAMHKVWRGFGNYFYGDDRWQEAREHYRSSAMREMIATARELFEA